MKKEVALILLGTLLLTGCNSNNGDSNDDEEEIELIFNDKFLEYLRYGVKGQTKYTESKKEYTNQFSFNDKGCSLKNISNGQVNTFETYLKKKKDDYIYATRLNIENTIDYTMVYNVYSQEYYTWMDGYMSPFIFTSLEDLIIDEKGTSLEINNSAIENNLSLNNCLSTMLYGNPGIEIRDVKMNIFNEKIYLTANGSFEEKYSYKFNTEITGLGEKVELEYRAKAIESEEIKEIEDLKTNLKNNNYTMEIKQFVNNEASSESIYYTQDSKIYYEHDGYKIGYYYRNALLQQVEKREDNKFYASDESFDTLNNYRAKFNFSSKCFIKNNDGSYIMNPSVEEGDVSCICVLEVSMASLINFSLKINEGSYVFRNENASGDKAIEITFKNVGSTEVPFNESEVIFEK